MNAPRAAELVSIVLPTYKRAHVLPAAIRSVLAQTYPHWELIVVDDHSPDNTSEVMAEFTDPRIRYERNPQNLRLPGTLNRGFSMARGDYLTWTSDDNLYDPRAIERMVHSLREGHCDLVYADYYQFSEEEADGRPLDPQLAKLPEQVQLDRGNHMGACFLYTRSLSDTIGPYDTELFLVEDYDFFMRASKRFTFRHLAEPLYYFRRDDATLYLSRYAEVKVSDVLARYKNALIDENRVLEILAELLLRNMSGLTSPLLRWTHQAVHNRSYRMSQWQQRLAGDVIRRKLRQPTLRILNDYRNRCIAFADARDALRKVVDAVGQLRYA